MQCTHRYHDTISHQYRFCHLQKGHKGMHEWISPWYSGGIVWNKKQVLFIG